MTLEPRFPLMVALLVLFCTGAGSAVQAQTPDGAPPANEGVCDGLEYMTPGLYGLCVAFCEAQDCEPDFTAEDPFQSCNPSSLALLNVYRGRMQPGDPDMPCVQAPCPCWTEQELAGLRHPSWSEDTIQYDKGSSFAYFSFSRPYAYQVDVMAYSTGVSYCSLWDRCESGYECLDVARFFMITAEQFAICWEQLVLAGRERGLPGF